MSKKSSLKRLVSKNVQTWIINQLGIYVPIDLIYIRIHKQRTDYYKNVIQNVSFGYKLSAGTNVEIFRTIDAITFEKQNSKYRPFNRNITYVNNSFVKLYENI